MNRFNPIRGLKPEKLADQLDAYDKGRPRECAILWQEMEERDLMIGNVASKRKQAVSRAQWEVLTIGTSPEALQQKEALEVFYNNLVATSILKQDERGGMGLLQRQMMDAVCKGFSVHDIAWKPLKGRGTQRSLNRRQRKQSIQGNAPDASGGPELTEGEFLTATFTHAPLQFFENKTGKLRFLQKEFDVDGVQMKEGEWLVTCSRPLMKAASIGYVYKHLPLKFWVGYCEKFGMPGVLAKVNGKPGDPQWDEAEQAVAQFMNDWAGVINLESVIELLETKGGGANVPFAPLIEYIDRMIASAFRGADLSTISQGKGDGTGASIQGDETNLLQEDDAAFVTETFWDQIDRQVLWAVLGVDEPLAYLKILPPKKQAVDQDIKIDEFLLKWGVKLSQDDELERYGRSAAEEGDAILEMATAETDASPAGGLPGQGRLPGEGRDVASKLENTLWKKIKGALGLANEISPEMKMRAAQRELFRPFTERLQRISAMTDRDQQRNALTLVLADLPSLKAQLAEKAGSGALAETLANEMKAALLEGISKGKKTR